MSPAVAMRFNPDEPVERQLTGYTCSVASLYWCLRSIGVDVTQQALQNMMVPDLVTSELGLLDASGESLARLARQHWGLAASNQTTVSFEEIVRRAGRQPVAIGGRGWDHWVGVRRSDGTRLILANPGGTGPQFGQQTLDRDDFATLGPFAAVWIDVPVAVPATPPVTRFRVANTDGAGANVRLTPSALGERVTGLAEGAVVKGDEHAWRQIRTADGLEGWVAAELLEPFIDELTSEQDHRFSFGELWPDIQATAETPEIAAVVAAIAQQESGFVNWRVHQDGTGHGLFGLDDNGLLPEFERWSGFAAGRGQNAVSIPPDLQIEFCARTIAGIARQYSGAFNAARVWNRGPTFWQDDQGAAYEQLIRSHVADIESGRLA